LGGPTGFDTTVFLAVVGVAAAFLVTSSILALRRIKRN
jgi:hypothetical protein